MQWLWLCLAWFFVPDAAAQGLAGFLSPGPLAEPHAELDTVTGCPSCHAPGQGVTPDRCLACHESVQDQVKTRTGFHADKAEGCAQCHGDHKGRSFRLVQLAEEGFDHGTTRFPLEGPHATTECVDCHTKPGVWTGLQTACTSCHEEVHGSDRRALDRCADCHAVVKDWDVPAPIPSAVFDHTDARQVDWILEGAHLDVGCTECHVEAVFSPTDFASCTDCHTDPHRAPFGQQCESCHTVRTFRVPDFDHDRAGWPLEGQHASVGCRTCHGERSTDPLPHATCADCHADPHRGQFAPRPCDACHPVEVADFRVERFDHDATDYPLRGRHATVACADCHGKGKKARYVDLPHEDCDSCHEDAHEGRFEPTPCLRCHGEEGWGVEDFDHARTDFPLEGAHVGVTCETCHPDGRWSGIAHGTCADCHADEDPHEAAFPPERCTECHTAASWAERIYDHAAKTTFPLEPQHGGVACLGCHTLTRFTGLGKACVDCHEEARPWGHYAGACDECHAAATWIPADLGDRDHAITGFPLEGLHSRLPCEGCHAPGQPHAQADGACVACHATDDVHRHGLGDACGDCHVPLTWARTRFRHFSTGWPLRGAHRLVACDGCHAASYVATPTDCATCHAGEADLSVAAHRSTFFLACEECHQPYTWTAAGFAH